MELTPNIAASAECFATGALDYHKLDCRFGLPLLMMKTKSHNDYTEHV